MKHDTRKTIVATFMVAAVLLTVSAAGAYDTDAIDPPIGPIVLSIRPDPAWRASESPWTPRKRLASQPRPTVEVTTEQLTGLFAESKEPSTTGEPGFAPGSLPQPGADAEARAAFPDEWADVAVADAGVEETGADSGVQSALTGNGAYTAFFGNKYSPMWKHHPYRAVGKLYFETPDGPAYCTAAVIGPDLIVTAARCILDTESDTIYANFAFCPAARGAVCPYGTFPWSGASLQSAYMDATSWVTVINIDIAMVHLESNRAGRGVHSYTGWLGRAWNLPPNRHTFAFGYPATRQGSNFSYLCAGETFETGEEVLEMGCDSGFGHLGGPWLVNFAPYVAETANYINSITSYQYTRGRNAIGGPRFSLENIAVLCDAVPDC